MKIIKPGKKEEFTLEGECDDCDCKFSAEITECQFSIVTYNRDHLQAQCRCPNCQAMVELKPKVVEKLKSAAPLPEIKPITTQLAHVSTDDYNARPDPNAPESPKEVLP